MSSGVNDAAEIPRARGAEIGGVKGVEAASSVTSEHPQQNTLIHLKVQM